MKKLTKGLLAGGLAAVLSFALVSISCGKINVKGNAGTVYAETSAIVPEETLKIVEALQNSFRAISQGLLPSVVEVDVTETKTVTTIDPFEDFRKFFFGNPGGSDGESGKKQQCPPRL